MRGIVAVAAVGALAAACAPATNPPTFPVATGGRLIVQVVDSVNDAGRAPAVAFDSRGNPSVSYLLYTEVPKPGELPPAIVPGTPQPPSVLVASQANGQWNRVAASGMNVVGSAVGLAKDIASDKNQAIPGVATGLAVDPQGKHHVVWSSPKGGVFYSTDATGGYASPAEITKDQAFGASIAAGPGGAVWVAFYRGQTVTAASLSGTTWKTENVTATGGSPGAAAQVTAVRVASNGEPVIAFGDGGATVVAWRTGGKWQTSRVPGPGGYGISLALDKSDSPTVAYYDAQGGVHEARLSGGFHGGPPAGSAWSVTSLGTTSPGPGGSGDPRWSTGVAVDDHGGQVLSWADTRANQIMFAAASQGGGGTPQAQPVPNSEGGTNPSIAVTPDGRSVAIAWYDLANGNLDVATTPSGGFALAFPTPTLQQPSVPAASPTAACKPTGSTKLTVAAPVGASASGFDTKCLAVPANVAFTLTFNNQDTGVPHNVALFTDSSATKRIGGASSAGDIVTGPATVTYKIGPLKPGIYYFHCDVHPTTMTGTFVVGSP